MSSNLIGQILLNQFRIDSFTASGGMGAVYRVWDLKRNVPLAMKVLHADLADDPAVFRKFKREARALEKLAHPNIVPFYGLHQTEDFAFLLERFIDGPSLKDILREQKRKPLSTEETLTFLKALCAALGYAHANGVVHCDVKPGNVMVDQGGNVYLTDFGVARHAESTTTTLGTAGTPAYMAPEQIRGEAVNPATDVYALGVMLFEMLTGQRPFRGEEAGTLSVDSSISERIRHAHLHVPPPDPRNFNLSILQELAKVILKCLAKDPFKRFASMQDLLLAACIALDTNPAQIPNRLSPTALPAKARKPKLVTPISSTPPDTPPDNYAGFKPTIPTLRTKRLSGTNLVLLLGGALFLSLIVFLNFSRGTSVPPSPSQSFPSSGSTAMLSSSGIVGDSQDRIVIAPGSTATHLPTAEGGLEPNTALPPALPTPTSPIPIDDTVTSEPVLPPNPTITSQPNSEPTLNSYPLPPSPEVPPTYSPLAGCASSSLHLGDWAYVSFGGGPNFIRDNPDVHVSDNIIGSAPEGEPMQIVGGPECSYGWILWKVLAAHGLKGWTAESDGKVFWLEPGFSWQPCSGAPHSRLKVNDRAMLSLYPQIANHVRERAGTNAADLGVILPGEELKVLEGPACSGGLVWWKVRVIGKDLQGWTAEGDKRDFWLIPLPNKE